ncbi:MAG: TIR domain-containing protein [Desulfobulbaceae bacterium]|nr:TIR domain-containing protein [Desulfobulbaceae bacterium]
MIKAGQEGSSQHPAVLKPSTLPIERLSINRKLQQNKETWATKEMTEPVIFVSYSHRDEVEKNKLITHLCVLHKADLINVWNDDRIGAGSDWEREINDAMTEAEVAILLISANFLNSDFILRKEVPILLERRKNEGLIVFPIIAKSCAWKKIDWLTKMNVRPNNGTPIWGTPKKGVVDRELSVISEEVADVINKKKIAIDHPSNNLDKNNLNNFSPIYIGSTKLNLDSLSDLITKTTNLANRLFHEESFIATDILFEKLEEFLDVSFERGLPVEIYSDIHNTKEIILSIHDLRIKLLSAVTLNSEGDGPLKWLVKETAKALKKKQVLSDSIPYKVWEYICRRYCNHLSEYHNHKILERISTVAIELTNSRDYDLLYRFFNFLYTQLESDTLSIRKVAELLQLYDDELGNNAEPSFLERLKRLIGTGINISIHGLHDIPPFSPDMTMIKNSTYCDYTFESMIFPLTIYDYSSIRGVLPKNLRENSKDPYLFKLVSEYKESLFNLLASEVFSIVQLCQQFESNAQYCWDVPTLIEWLALADCEDKPYPWGNTPPTPSHANLHFGTRPSKLRPVGSHPLGVSKYGVHDCCGNVHEIVRISFENNFPDDFRLAGGCYQNHDAFSSCQIIRRFKSKNDDNRKNIGLRLLRYEISDRRKRKETLERFLSSKPSS